MLSNRLTVTAKPIEALEAFTASYETIVTEEFNAAVDTVQPYALADLRTSVPPRRQWPGDYPGGQLEWESEKQRRYWWAVLAEFDSAGNLIPYERSGDIPKAWALERRSGAAVRSVSIVNRNPKSKWVYGSLSRRNARKFQQRFHNVTGWFVGGERVNFWLDVIQSQTEINVNDRLKDLAGTRTFQRRAFTPPTFRGGIRA